MIRNIDFLKSPSIDQSVRYLAKHNHMTVSL